MVKIRPYYFDLSDVLKVPFTFKTTCGTSISHTSPLIQEKIPGPYEGRTQRRTKLC
jgi:hypothetical protein